GLLFGIGPALYGSRGRGVGAFLLTGARGTAGSTTRDGRTFQRALVILEVALSLMLLASAGLLIKSFAKLRRIDPGFRTDGVLTFDLSLRQRSNEPEARLALRRDGTALLLQRLTAVPGVEAAAVVSGLPMSGATFILPFDVEGRPTQPGKQLASELRGVSER